MKIDGNAIGKDLQLTIDKCTLFALTLQCAMRIMQASKGVECMATTNVTIRMDENLKKQAETIFDEMGMNMTTAMTIFAKAVVRQGKIPFEIAVDPFWSETNQAHLRKVIQEYESGTAKLIAKTADELEAMADE